MEYTLMHKSIPVVDMKIDETGYIAKISASHDMRHLPLGIAFSKSGIDRKALNDWWLGRAIPASRFGLHMALQRLGVSAPALLLQKCYGLSLSDQYWVRPKNSDLRWEDVNFFENDFSRDVGEILFGREPADPSHVSLMSPDNTSDGWLQKKWVIAGDRRILMKGGSGPYQQEPFNEVIASRLCQRLAIDHVTYTLTKNERKPYSLCENFVTPDCELVPAWRLLLTQKQPNNRSLRDHFLHCCEALGVQGAEATLDRLLTLDYLIANEDRHWNNFGLLRNAETLAWIGFAPVYDSGTSLWYNTLRVGSQTESKPFRKNHDEQIKLVSSLDWFDTDALRSVEDEMMGVFSDSDDVDAVRGAAIAKAVRQRIDSLGLRNHVGV